MTNRIRITLISISSVLVLYVFLGGLLGKSESNSEKTYRDLGVYSEVLNRINLDYVTEPDLKKVTDGAIRGLLEALDPYSTYLTPTEYKAYQEHPDPGPASVGIYLSKRSGYVTVVSVLPGSPAEKAGIRAGDLIDRVEASAHPRTFRGADRAPVGRRARHHGKGLCGAGSARRAVRRFP